MSRIRINRNKAKFRGLLGIRARLVLFALILVGPLMADRIRSLESVRTAQIETANRDFISIADHSIDAQREVFSSVEAVLKSSAYIYTSAAQMDRSCAIMRASLRDDMPWIRSLTVARADGSARCSTWSAVVDQGLNFADRPYFRKAVATGEFVVSDYLFGRISNHPSVVAAYLAPGLTHDDDAVILAVINLDWMSKIMNGLAGRAGVTAALVDASGTVLAAPSDQASMVGHAMGEPGILAAVAANIGTSARQTGTLQYTSANGIERTISYAALPGTTAKLIVDIDEARVSASADRDIRTAFLQLGFVCLFVLLGALVVAERLIIQPITLLEAMAKRFGDGDWSARAARSRLPSEFVPLARAFYGMAAQLRERESELRARNDQLTVIASVDMLSGLANRRGFQSRLDFEWLKAQQSGDDLALMMIDVDHFKLFNDSYGHPEGDACLARLGEVLGNIASQTSGFAGRYGGEEFCLLLPNTDIDRAALIGEMIRAEVVALEIQHATSAFQQVTVSIGVASAAPSRLESAGDLIEAADAALYAAKGRGRNMVVEHGFVRIYDTPAALAG
jgi:diguanylate cyclase (GGDEF)-like protein